jgi:hypothetical protein
MTTRSTFLVSDMWPTNNFFFPRHFLTSISFLSKFREWNVKQIKFNTKPWNLKKQRGTKKKKR